MNWIILILAGLCECGFTFCLGKAREAAGTNRLLWLAGFLIFCVVSMMLLMRAVRSLPLGTAYPVWTGIGAVGTVLLGIVFFHEPVTFWRVFFITTLIGSIIGLDAVSP